MRISKRELNNGIDLKIKINDILVKMIDEGITNAIELENREILKD